MLATACFQDCRLRSTCSDAHVICDAGVVQVHLWGHTAQSGRCQDLPECGPRRPGTPLHILACTNASLQFVARFRFQRTDCSEETQAFAYARLAVSWTL